jgi:hypothetical protein
MITCCICEEDIAKYEMDVGDTVFVEVQDETKYICDDCARDIAKQLIER